MALATTGEIPALVKLRGEVPARPGGDDQAPRARTEAGAAALRGARDRLAREPARSGDGRTVSASSRDSAPRPSRRCSRRSTAYAQAGPAQRIVLSRALAVGEELLAEILRAAGHRRRPSSPARRGAWPRASRTSTSSRPRPTPGRWPRPWRRSRRSRRPRPRDPTRSGSARTRAINVDVRIVEPDQFGNVLQHLTGSKQHNVALRDFAVRRGLHISEYGVLDDNTGITHRCATEAEVYALLGMDYIPPELREDRGELEAALNGTTARARHRRRPQGRPALPHDRLRRHRLDRGDGRGSARTPATSTWRSPTTRRRWASAPTSRDDQLKAPDRADPRGRRDAAGAHAARRVGGQHPARTARSTTPTSCWPSSTGSWPASTPRSGCPRPR